MGLNDELVEITYQANVVGLDDVRNLKNQNAELQAQTDSNKSKVREATLVQEKHTNALLSARRAVIDIRKELFIFGFAIGTLTTLMAALSRGSNDLASAMQSLGRDAAAASKPVGDFLAKIVRYLGGKGFTAPDLGTDNQLQLSRLFSDIDTLRGNTHAALVEKLRAEEIALADKVGDKWNTTFKRVFDERKKLLLEEHDLAVLGLKTQARIAADFRRGIVTSAQGATAGVFESVLKGEPQSGEEMLKSYRDAFASTIAESMSQSLFTTFATGGNFFSNFRNILTGRTPQVIAAERAAKASEDTVGLSNQMLAVLNQIAECTCSTAKSISGASVTMPGGGGGSKVGAIAGLFGAVAGLGAFGAAAGGFRPGPMPGPSLGVDLMPARASGGEIPFMGMPGEYVVRRPGAMENKDLLQEINAGGNLKSAGGGNVFIINATDAQSFVDMLSSTQSRAMIEVQVMRAIMENGGVRRVIREYAR